MLPEISHYKIIFNWEVKPISILSSNTLTLNILVAFDNTDPDNHVIELRAFSFPPFFPI